MLGKDITGLRVQRLIVLGISDKKDERGRTFWSCRCDCGTELILPRKSLVIKKNPTRSCGCLQREKAAKQAKSMGDGNKTHGMTDSPEWIVWKSITGRCRSKKSRYYGAKGITVCERWESSFENFYKDVGPRPSMAHTLDRKDNSKGYSPDNCRWATHKQQQRNRTNNRKITHGGRTMLLSEWAEEYGIVMQRLHSRLNRGWPIELALTTPIGVWPYLPPLTERGLPPDVLAKLQAGIELRQALKYGIITKDVHCQHPGCTTEKVQGHHHKGYAKEHWLDVIWLCRKHHEEAEIWMTEDKLRCV